MVKVFRPRGAFANTAATVVAGALLIFNSDAWPRAKCCICDDCLKGKYHSVEQEEGEEEEELNEDFDLQEPIEFDDLPMTDVDSALEFFEAELEVDIERTEQDIQDRSRLINLIREREQLQRLFEEFVSLVGPSTT